MAKIIKYQFATKHPYDVVVVVPLLDDEGNPVMEEVVVPVLDENGYPTFDENGEPVVEVTYEPVMVEEIRQEYDVTLTEKSITCYNEDSFQTGLLIANEEAYNGEYTVEDDGEPEPDTTTTDDVLNALLGVTV